MPMDGPVAPNSVDQDGLGIAKQFSEMLKEEAQHCTKPNECLYELG